MDPPKRLGKLIVIGKLILISSSASRPQGVYTYCNIRHIHQLTAVYNIMVDMFMSKCINTRINIIHNFGKNK